MRNLYIITILSVLLFSCERDPQNVQPVWSGTNILEGEWTMKVYKGQLVKNPMKGSLVMVAKSDTTGTATFDMTIDGQTNNIEYAWYDIKNSEKRIYFSRTVGGNSGILVHSEKWEVDELILHDDNKLDTLEMHSNVTGEQMLLSKP